MGKSFEEIVTGGVMDLFSSGPEKPKAQPKAAPPVTMQDKNVREAAQNQSRRMAASSRAKSKVVKEYGSTVGVG